MSTYHFWFIGHQLSSTTHWDAVVDHIRRAIRTALPDSSFDVSVDFSTGAQNVYDGGGWRTVPVKIYTYDEELTPGMEASLLEACLSGTARYQDANPGHTLFNYPMGKLEKEREVVPPPGAVIISRK